MCMLETRDSEPLHLRPRRAIEGEGKPKGTNGARLTVVVMLSASLGSVAEDEAERGYCFVDFSKSAEKKRGDQGWMGGLPRARAFELVLGMYFATVPYFMQRWSE